MNFLIKYFLNNKKKLFRFIFVGVATFTLNISLVHFFYGFLQINYKFSATYAYVLTLCVHFLLHRFFTYSSGGGKIQSDSLRYSIVPIINYFITLTITFLTVEFIMLTPYHGVFFSTLCTAVSSFLLMNHFVFSVRDKKA